MERIDILKIDNRGRINIPSYIWDALEVLDKKKVRILAVWSEDTPEIRIERIMTKKTTESTATFRLESKELPKSYENEIKSFSKDMWGLEPKFEKGYKQKELKVNTGGRIVIPKILREQLNLDENSFIMVISNLIDKYLTLKKALVIQIKKGNSYEWRAISPIPDDLDVFEREFRKNEKIDDLIFLYTDSIQTEYKK